MTSAVDFPNPELRALSSVIHLLGVSILSYCFARRTVRENILSFRSWGQISWPRWLVILVFLDSWLFIFFAGVLISGVGMARSSLACNMGIYSCIIFYASSKVLIYLFLIEKVYVVWPNRGTTRWTSRAYLVCLFTMSGYIVIIVLMILGKIAYHRTDGQCIIGLETLASVSLLSYDLFLNVFLTGMFIWPLTRSKFVKASLRRVASRTLIAALAALTTSTVNIAVLTVLHGKQLGWVCLGSCGADVTINAIILFWVTSSGSGDGNSTPAPPVAVSNRTVKTTTHRQGTECPRFSVKLPNETSGSSPGRLTFATSGPDGQPHSYPPAVREEDEDSADTEKKDGKPKKFFRKVGNVLGLQSKDAHARETQQMSVQVTITTEYDVLQEGRYKRDDDGDDSRRMPSVDYAASSTDRTPR